MQIKNDLKARSFSVYSLYVDLGTPAAMLEEKTAEVHVNRDVFQGRVETVRPTQIALVSSAAINDCWRTYRQTVRPSAHLAADDKQKVATSDDYSTALDGQGRRVSARQNTSFAREDIIGRERTATHCFGQPAAWARKSRWSEANQRGQLAQSALDALLSSRKVAASL